MHRSFASLLAIAMAGCLSSGSDVQTPAAPLLPGLNAYFACPVENGTVTPCEVVGDDHVELDMRTTIPTGWSCVTWADQRFDHGEDAYPYPDWYTYYGAYLGDGGANAAEHRAGILYDAHNDTSTVGGAAVLVLEDEARVYTWNGPSRGFVMFPTPITESRLLLYGVLFPGEPGENSSLRPTQERFGPPRFDVASDPPLSYLQPFWSMRDFVPEGEWAGWGGEPRSEWTMVLNAELAGRTLHIPTHRDARLAFGDTIDLAGGGHWGQGRAAPFNATVRAEGLTFDASLQPYMEFYAEFRGLDPASLALADYMCGCGDVPLVTVEGVFCQLGVPPPVVSVATSPDGRHRSLRLG